MKHTQEIHCPLCESSDLQKNGHSENDTQRWRCIHCRKSFQLSYRYNARKLFIKLLIFRLALSIFFLLQNQRTMYSNLSAVIPSDIFPILLIPILHPRAIIAA